MKRAHVWPGLAAFVALLAAGCSVHSMRYVHVEGASSSGGRACYANVPTASWFEVAGTTLRVSMDLEGKPDGSSLGIYAPRGAKVSVSNAYIEISTAGSTAIKAPLRYAGVVEDSGILKPYSSGASGAQVGREDYYPFSFTRPPSSTGGSLRLPEMDVGNARIPARVLRFEERTHVWINCNA